MIESRIVFLLLTSCMLALLIGIALFTLRSSRKQKLEEPKYRMLDDD